MTETKWLPMYARVNAFVDMQAIKDAKAATGLDLKVYPVSVTEENVANVDRALAIGAIPPWNINYFLVAENASHDELTQALRWVLTDEEDWEATLVIDQLQAAMSTIREIPEAELVAEKKMSDYLNGRV